MYNFLLINIAIIVFGYENIYFTPSLNNRNNIRKRTTVRKIV